MEEILLDDLELDTQDINDVEYAGFWNRFGAILIDGIVIGIPLKIIEVVVGGENEMATIIIAIIGLVVRWLYFALQESSPSQATLGKKALGIRVVDIEGDKISFGRASGRYFGKIISGLILTIGYIMAGFTDKKQALHDMMAKTLVIKD